MHQISFKWSWLQVSLFSLYCSIHIPSSYSPRHHKTPRQSPCCSNPSPCMSFSCSLHLVQIPTLIWWLLQIWDLMLLSWQTNQPSFVCCRDTRGQQTACPCQVCLMVLNCVAPNLHQLRSCTTDSHFWATSWRMVCCGNRIYWVWHPNHSLRPAHCSLTPLGGQAPGPHGFLSWKGFGPQWLVGCKYYLRKWFHDVGWLQLGW